jgi:hypothetical protein
VAHQKMNKRKIIADIISVLIALLVIVEVIRFLTSDFTRSLVPGWHTTAYPKNWFFPIAAAVLLALTYLVYRLVIFLRRVTRKIMEHLEKN